MLSAVGKNMLWRRAVVSRWPWCRSMGSSSRMDRPPVLDLSAFVATGDDRAQQQQHVALAVKAACEEWGCFYLTNLSALGLDLSCRTSALASVADYFAMSAADKARSTSPSNRPGFARGAIGVGGESGSHMFEAKEAFSYGYAWPHNTAPIGHNALQGANVWPDPVVVGRAFRPAMEEFYRGMCTVGDVTARALSMAIAGHDRTFAPPTAASPHDLGDGDTISLMRAFRYLPIDQAQRLAEGRPHTGSSEHTDWGLLTLILQNPFPTAQTGLQLHRPRTNTWVDASPIEHTLFVNVGDYVSLLTGGRFRSPLHRVALGPTERQSLVFFYYPAFDTRIPLPALQSDAALSLLKNQNHEASAMGAVEDRQALSRLSFGAWIAHKWASVTRSA